MWGSIGRGSGRNPRKVIAFQKKIAAPRSHPPRFVTVHIPPWFVSHKAVPPKKNVLGSPEGHRPFGGSRAAPWWGFGGEAPDPDRGSERLRINPLLGLFNRGVKGKRDAGSTGTIKKTGRMTRRTKPYCGGAWPNAIDLHCATETYGIHSGGKGDNERASSNADGIGDPGRDTGLGRMGR
jgi:hypothetical protein